MFINNFDSADFIAVNSNILSYLKKAEIIAATGCRIIDEITNEETNIELLAYSDGKYIWDSRDIYYYENYGMPLNADFIKSVV